MKKLTILTIAIVFTLFGAIGIKDVSAATIHDCKPGQLVNSLDGSTPCSVIATCVAGDLINHRTGLACPGVANTQVQTTIDPKALGVVKVKDSNKDLVKEIQKALVALGYDIKIDGIFGSQTQGKIIAIQRAAGIKRDGIVGANTFNVIQKELDKKGIKISLINNATRIRKVSYDKEIQEFITNARKEININDSRTWGTIVSDQPNSKWYKKTYTPDSRGNERTFYMHIHQ